MQKYQKRLIQLPPEIKKKLSETSNPDMRDAYVRALRNAGWTLESVATPLNISRERVRQICATKDSENILPSDYEVPEPPLVVEKRSTRVFVEPEPETLARLLELQPMAQQVRSHSARYRAEAEEYTRLVAKAHLEEGVTLYRLAKRLGVSHPALRFRLARYGYKLSENGKSKVYTPIKSENRA